MSEEHKYLDDPKIQESLAREHAIELDTERSKRILSEVEKSWAGFFVKYFRVSYIIVAMVLLFGFLSIFLIPKESTPEINVPYALVTTIYPGSSPSDTEELITNKLEEDIKDIDNINKLDSSSSEGVSVIFVEFDAEANIDESLTDLKDAVDTAKSKLPNDVEDPIVKRVQIDDQAIVTLSLKGNVSEDKLQENAKSLQSNLERISGVSEVVLTGDREKQYQVLIDRNKLEGYQISIGEIISAIRSSNISLPLGDISLNGLKYGIRFNAKFVHKEDIASIPVRSVGESTIYIKDIADVVEEFEERQSVSLLSLGTQGAEPAISLGVKKKSGGSILEIVDNVKTVANEMKEKNEFYPSVTVQVTSDFSEFVAEDLNTLSSSGVQTILLIILVLFLALGYKEALLTALSVPISFLLALAYLYFTGNTLNSMTLFAMVLGLGLLVDNAIVIMEGIHYEINVNKRSAYDAALMSIYTYKNSLISGTLTTVGAFLPMLLVSGIMGQYLRAMPVTISIVLISSLFVSLAIIPAVTARVLRKHRTKEKTQFEQKLEKIQKASFAWMRSLEQKYIDWMPGLLESPSKRKKFIWGTFGVFVLSIIAIALFVKVELFPVTDFRYFTVTLDTPIGSSLNYTENKAHEFEKRIKGIKEIESYVISIGSGKDNAATITINLLPKDKRSRKSYDVADEIREKMKGIQDANIQLTELKAGPPSGAPIEVRITGPDLIVLDKISKEVGEKLKNIPDTLNVEDDFEDSAGDFIFTVNREKMSYYGLSSSQVAMALRQSIYGVEADKIRINDEDVSIFVKIADQNFKNFNDLEQIQILSSKGELIPMSKITETNIGSSVSTIKHRLAERVVRVTAYNGERTATEIVADLEKWLKEEYKVPNKYSVSIGGETEDIEKSFTELFSSMILAVFIILFILILQFNSYAIPGYIMLSLPLSLIGVAFGLILTQSPFSFSAFIGIISLCGIVVNDAIVLIDKVNYNYYTVKMDIVNAIIEAGASRMQPIFLTTLTTAVGVLTLIFNDEFWIGMSYTVTFGLSFATLLTLIFIPVMYIGHIEKKEKKGLINRLE